MSELNKATLAEHLQSVEKKIETLLSADYQTAEYIRRHEIVKLRMALLRLIASDDDALKIVVNSAVLWDFLYPSNQKVNEP